MGVQMGSRGPREHLPHLEGSQLLPHNSCPRGGLLHLPVTPFVCPRDQGSASHGWLPNPPTCWGCSDRQLVVAAAVCCHRGTHHGLRGKDWWSRGTRKARHCSAQALVLSVCDEAPAQPVRRPCPSRTIPIMSPHPAMTYEAGVLTPSVTQAETALGGK